MGVGFENMNAPMSRCWLDSRLISVGRPSCVVSCGARAAWQALGNTPASEAMAHYAALAARLLPPDRESARAHDSADKSGASDQSADPDRDAQQSGEPVLYLILRPTPLSMPHSKHITSVLSQHAGVGADSAGGGALGGPVFSSFAGEEDSLQASEASSIEQLTACNPITFLARSPSLLRLDLTCIFIRMTPPSLYNKEHQLIGSYCGASHVLVQGQSELHRAAARGEAEAVRKLLSGGAAPDVRDSDGCSALHWAADRGHVQVAVCCRTLTLDFCSCRTFHYVPSAWPDHPSPWSRPSVSQINDHQGWNCS